MSGHKKNQWDAFVKNTKLEIEEKKEQETEARSTLTFEQMAYLVNGRDAFKKTSKPVWVIAGPADLSVILSQTQLHQIGDEFFAVIRTHQHYMVIYGIYGRVVKDKENDNQISKDQTLRFFIADSQGWHWRYYPTRNIVNTLVHHFGNDIEIYLSNTELQSQQNQAGCSVFALDTLHCLCKDGQTFIQQLCDLPIEENEHIVQHQGVVKILKKNALPDILTTYLAEQFQYKEHADVVSIQKRIKHYQALTQHITSPRSLQTLSEWQHVSGLSSFIEIDSDNLFHIEMSEKDNQYVMTIHFENKEDYLYGNCLLFSNKPYPIDIAPSDLRFSTELIFSDNEMQIEKNDKNRTVELKAEKSQAIRKRINALNDTDNVLKLYAQGLRQHVAINRFVQEANEALKMYIVMKPGKEGGLSQDEVHHALIYFFAAEKHVGVLPIYVHISHPELAHETEKALQTYDQVICSLAIDEEHQVAVIVDKKQKTITIIDSKNNKHAETLKSIFHANEIFKEYLIIDKNPLQQQKNDGSCGVHVVLNILNELNHPDFIENRSKELDFWLRKIIRADVIEAQKEVENKQNETALQKIMNLFEQSHISSKHSGEKSAIIDMRSDPRTLISSELKSVLDEQKTLNEKFSLIEKLLSQSLGLSKPDTDDLIIADIKNMLPNLSAEAFNNILIVQLWEMAQQLHSQEAVKMERFRISGKHRKSREESISERIAQIKKSLAEHADKYNNALGALTQYGNIVLGLSPESWCLILQNVKVDDHFLKAVNTRLVETERSTLLDALLTVLHTQKQFDAIKALITEKNLPTLLAGQSGAAILSVLCYVPEFDLKKMPKDCRKTLNAYLSYLLKNLKMDVDPVAIENQIKQMTSVDNIRESLLSPFLDPKTSEKAIGFIFYLPDPLRLEFLSRFSEPKWVNDFPGFFVNFAKSNFIPSLILLDLVKKYQTKLFVNAKNLKKIAEFFPFETRIELIKQNEKLIKNGYDLSKIISLYPENDRPNAVKEWLNKITISRSFELYMILQELKNLSGVTELIKEIVYSNIKIFETDNYIFDIVQLLPADSRMDYLYKVLDQSKLRSISQFQLNNLLELFGENKKEQYNVLIKLITTFPSSISNKEMKTLANGYAKCITDISQLEQIVLKLPTDYRSEYIEKFVNAPSNVENPEFSILRANQFTLFQQKQDSSSSEKSNDVTKDKTSKRGLD